MMDIYIYDIEVFKYNWLLVARRPEDGAPYTVIWDDNYRLREWLNNAPDIIGGFNNKHYDDYVIMVMLNGGSNADVKRCNDYIIGGGQPWSFPFIQYQKKPFKSFDLRDDIADPGISLKAIEGNLKIPIIECTEVPFDIDRPLTEDEKRIVERYCKHDVDSTVKLYWERKKNYLDAKVLAGGMYGIAPEDALGFTNARLSAEALHAKYKERSDERDYIIPPNLDPKRIPKIVLDFFLQIRDKSIPDAVLFGAGKGAKGLTLKLILRSGGGSCPVTYAWGGVHGAKPCVTIEETEDRVIINQDVGSLYPNSMINFGYTSRSMEDPKAYEKLVKKRLEFKGLKKKANKAISSKLGGSWYHEYETEDKDGNTYFDLDKAKSKTDEETYQNIVNYLDYDAKQSSLKLIINTCYGAMLSAGNGLNDRLGGRSVCITNQLAMSILISDLCKQCKSIDFVNINTDGIMFTIDRKEVDLSERIVADWCTLTGFTMERDDFSKVIQKDVNNYIGIYSDGHFKTKGGFVSLYDGGNFKTNSLQIIHKAIVDKLVKGIDPEVTIRECKDVTAFQQIIKTGGSYEGSYHYINGKREPVQKVNRIYAVKDPKYGAVVKGKWITEKRKKDKATGKMISTPVNPPVWSETVISECPEHTFIDNENKLRVEDLDLNYYIDMAKKRIDKYVNIDPKVKREIDKIKEEVVIMATEQKTDFSNWNVYKKLNYVRAKFMEAPVKKSGVNRYAEFKYFQLEDIVPVAEKLFNEVGLCLLTSIDFEGARAGLVNVDKIDESITFKAPAKDPQIEDGTKMSSIQGIGAYVTYQRRYLYGLILDLVEADVVDAVIGKGTAKEEAPKANNRPATVEERAEVKDELIDKDGEATKTQKTAISNGLKKLRAKYMGEDKKVFNADLEAKYEGYIKDTAKKVKAGVSKSEADQILIEIGNKVAEA